MLDIQPHELRVGDPGSRKYETFSYLPPFTEEQIRDQIRYIIDRGWTCAVEYTEPERADSAYWHMWKLPLFGVTDVDEVLRELKACREAHPDCLVRLMGYDNLRQTQGLTLVVYRPETEPEQC